MLRQGNVGHGQRNSTRHRDEQERESESEATHIGNKS